MNELKNDKNLQEAVSRREQKLPPMPADLNERLMQRLVEPERAPAAKQKRLWLYAAIAVAASIALLMVFNFGKQQSVEEPLVAHQTIKQAPPQFTSATVIEEPQEEAGQVKASSLPQSVKKHRKVVTKRVELIPTEEQDPFVMMAAQIEDIRSRGQRLHQKIEQRMSN